MNGAPNIGFIDLFTDTFSKYIDSGFGLLKGEVGYLASTLIVIDMTIAGLFWALAPDEDVLARLVKKTLYIGFFAFLIQNFSSLSNIIYSSFAGLGLKAAGSTVSLSHFAQPGTVAQTGLNAAFPLFDAAAHLSMWQFPLMFVLLAAYIIVILSFFVMAVQLFVTLIEFKLTSLAGFILVPFGLFNKTAFLAERVLGNVVASGVKVLVLAIVFGIGNTLFSTFAGMFTGSPLPTPTIDQAEGGGPCGVNTSRNFYLRSRRCHRSGLWRTPAWRWRSGWRCAGGRRFGYESDSGGRHDAEHISATCGDLAGWGSDVWWPIERWR